MIECYEINDSTLAIIPLTEKTSKVIEMNHSFVIGKSTTTIINDSCKYFGSSYIGRFEGTKNLIGVSYKSPIIIEESREIIFFPTSSPRFEKCSWISLNNVVKYIRDKENSIIYFKNGDNLHLKISYGSLDNQILRATRLESILRKRKNFEK